VRVRLSTVGSSTVLRGREYFNLHPGAAFRLREFGPYVLRDAEEVSTRLAGKRLADLASCRAKRRTCCRRYLFNGSFQSRASPQGNAEGERGGENEGAHKEFHRNHMIARHLWDACSFFLEGEREQKP